MESRCGVLTPIIPALRRLRQKIVDFKAKLAVRWVPGQWELKNKVLLHKNKFRKYTDYLRIKNIKFILWECQELILKCFIQHPTSSSAKQWTKNNFQVLEAFISAFSALQILHEKCFRGGSKEAERGRSQEKEDRDGEEGERRKRLRWRIRRRKRESNENNRKKRKQGREGWGGQVTMVVTTAQRSENSWRVDFK